MDSTLDIIKQLDACPRDGGSIILQKGEYHFWPDYADERYLFVSNNNHSLKRILFDLGGFKNFVFDGGGSELVIHGLLCPFVIEKSENITLRNFTVDCADSFYASGIVVKSEKDELILKPDRDICSYRIKNGTATFYGEGWECSKIHNFLEIGDDGKVLYNRGDDFCAGADIMTEVLDDGDLRFYNFSFGFTHTPGNRVIIGFMPRWCDTISCDRSSDIKIENVVIYHACGMGVVAQNTCNISLVNVSMLCRTDKNRVISLTADSTHFVNCTGLVSLANCHFEGQLDDPLNCHGIYTTIDKILSKHEIIVKLNHHEQVGVEIYELGDIITFINRKTLLGVSEGKITAVRRLNSSYFILSLEEALPDNVSTADAVENRSRMPELYIGNCRFGNNRARGPLITTPKKVIVENNEFYNQGSALLFDGDANYWFESGAVTDVLIRGNNFINCATVPMWGSAVISINIHADQSVAENIRYHRNIKIIGNIFNTFTDSLVSARSAEGIVFKGNVIIKNNDYPEFKNTVPGRYVNLINCSDCDINY